MDGATLHLLERLRTTGASGTPGVDAIEAFVMLVAGQPTLGPSERWWVSGIVDDCSGADPAIRSDAFRIAYDATADLPIVTHHAPSKRFLAVEGLMALPTPQRVAVALSAVLGFTPAEVSWVVGFSVENVQILLADATAAIRLANSQQRSQRAPGAA